MPKCTIDGKEAEFKPGESLIEVAKRVGVDIPFFCYHPGLTVVAQCRICRGQQRVHLEQHGSSRLPGRYGEAAGLEGDPLSAGASLGRGLCCRKQRHTDGQERQGT